jgi:hypothetical protein
MYTISHIMSYIHCNSCNLSNNTHPHRKTSSYNELQMVIVTQKPSCKASCKSPHFLIVPFLLSVIPPPIFGPPPYKVSIMSRLVLLTTSCTTLSFVSLNESTDTAKSGLSNANSLYPTSPKHKEQDNYFPNSPIIARMGKRFIYRHLTRCNQ